MNKNLTVGKPETVLLKFCLPLLGSMFFQQLYNIADSFVVGKFVSENAFAAVGNSYEITLIFLSVAFGCNMGCSVITGRFFGAKQYDNMKTAVCTSMISGAVVCVVFMVFGLVFCDGLLALIKTPEEVFADSKLYLDIYIWGMPFLFFYNISTGIFSALGDSKTPFIFLTVSSVSNILADILFVVAFDMGVAGVAWATFICQGISCIFSLIFVFKRLAGVKTEGKLKLFSFGILGKIATVGIPSILQQSFISIGNIIIQGVINSFGAGIMAGYTASIKLNNLAINSIATFGMGITNYTSQNVGAGELSRIRPGLKATLKMVWIMCVPVFLLYFFAGQPLVKFFIENPSNEAIVSGAQLLKIVSPFYFVVSIKLVCDGVLRGAGRMKSFMAATFTDILLRVVLSLIFSKSFGYIGIWMSWPVGWIVAMMISAVLYSVGPWRKAKEINAE